MNERKLEMSGGNFSDLINYTPLLPSSSSARSLVLNTFIFDCPFNALSPDHSEHRNRRATAKYGISLSWGEIVLASSKKGRSSSVGTISILCCNTLIKSFKSGSKSPAFACISKKFFSSSLKSRAGANSIISGENKTSSFLVSRFFPFEIIAENNSLASITKSIYSRPGKAFLSSWNIPWSIFSDNILASSSVNFDLATIPSKTICNADSSSRRFISSRVTSDQFTQEKCFISPLSSSETGIVKDTIYISPRRTISSNFRSCFTRISKRLRKNSRQFISGCWSSFSFSSLGMFTVIEAMFVWTREFVCIFKDCAGKGYREEMRSNTAQSRILPCA